MESTPAASATPSVSHAVEHSSDSTGPAAPLSPLRSTSVPRRHVPRMAAERFRPAVQGEKRPWGAPNLHSGIVTSRPAAAGEWRVRGIRVGGREFWYLVVLQGVGPALISGAINFGIGCACYLHLDGTRFWPFDPLTVAGDMGLTVVIQQAISTLITSGMVHVDMASGTYAPLSRVWPPLLHLPSSPEAHGSPLGTKLASDLKDGALIPMGRAEGGGVFKRYALWLVRYVCTGSERDDWLAKGLGVKVRVQRILWTVVHGLGLAVLTFWWFWPIAIAITAPIYGGADLSSSYTAPVLKGIYGFVLALITGPIIALLAMGAENTVRRAYPDEEPFISQPDGKAYLQSWRDELDASKSTDSSKAVEA